MANADNLIPADKRTPSERSAIARKAGIASGEARRRAKSFREAADYVLNQLVERKDKQGNIIDQITGYEAILLGQLDEAIRNHNTKAAKFIADIAQPKRIELTGADGAPLHIATTQVDLDKVDELHKKLLEAADDNK